MARKEDRERTRQERLAAEQAQAARDRRRLLVGYAVAGLIVAAIVVGVVLVIVGGGEDGDGSGDLEANAHLKPELGVVPEGAEPDGRAGTEPPPLQIGDLEVAAREAGCDLQLDLPSSGKGHFTDENRAVEAETKPPASGDHYGNPAEVSHGALADGAYLNTPPMARAVHALEHGRVAIQYSPELSEEQQLALKGVFDDSPEGMILFPNPDMPFAVAVVAWTDLAGCDSFRGDATLDVIRDFRDIYRGDGEEDVPLSVGG